MLQDSNLPWAMCWGVREMPQVTGERDAANSQNIDSRAGGRTAKVRSTIGPKQRCHRGEQQPVGEGWPCQEPVWWSYLGNP